MSETLGIFLQYTNEQHKVAMLNQETTVWPVLLFNFKGKVHPKMKHCSLFTFMFFQNLFFSSQKEYNLHYFCFDMSD